MPTPSDLRAALDEERAKTADVLGARDILSDWLDGHDNGYPLTNGDWEGDVVERARAALRASGARERAASQPESPHANRWLCGECGAAMDIP